MTKPSHFPSSRLPVICSAGLLALALVACSGGDEIAPQDYAPPSQGPRIVWDLGAQPLPEIPLPNDVATRADPSSPTGVRVNASLVAPTRYEATLRAGFDGMDGWGTFMPITVRFDQDLDIADLIARQGGEFDLTDDAIYLVNLETGVPVPIDVGNGNFPLSLDNAQGWFVNDPRAGQSNVLLSTVDEDTNHDGILQVDEDTNFDGVMQRASVFPRGGRPYDDLTTFWEPEGAAGGTLILRPMVALEERTRYAVVITDRLRGDNGPVRSPFDTIAHPSQLAWLRAMEQHLENATLSQRFFGPLRWNARSDGPGPNAHVAFAWTFVTQTTVTDLFDVREGLYDRGRLAAISRVAPDYRTFPARSGSNCTPEQRANRFIVPAADVQSLLHDLSSALGFSGAQADALVASFDWIDYMYIAQVDVPYLNGDPRSLDPDAHWDLNLAVSDPRSVGVDHVQLWVFVPKARPGVTAPFPVVFNAHGYGLGAIQGLAFAGYFARFGLATVAANAPVHGFPLGSSAGSAVRTLLRGRCLLDFATAAVAGRSRDLNGDGNEDSGGDFLSAHVFHTRDLIRQSALDYMQVVRAMTSPAFATAGTVDYNGDGRNDAPGDLNGDGTIDIGGTLPGGAPRPFYMWGESLGGITSMVLGGLDPAITAVAPISGGAGLTDICVRSAVDGVGGAVLGPTMTPVLVSIPATDRPTNTTTNATRTACHAGEFSLRWLVQDVTAIHELEFACSTFGTSDPQMRPGDDVVVLNSDKNVERCARVQPDGRLFLPIAADLGDRLYVRVLDGHRIQDYGRCSCGGSGECYLHIRRDIRTFEVGEGDCTQGCGHVPPDAPRGSFAQVNGYARTSPLVSPATGLGLRRQTGTLRRFLQLAQAGIDPGDPVSYAPLFFLHPRTSNPHPVLSMATIGDTAVPIAAANSFARAAGMLPFIRQATGTLLDEYATPAPMWQIYQRTPDGVLIDNFVIEGVSRLARRPVAGNPTYLFDPSDLDDGRAPWGEATLTPPLRIVRAARPLRESRPAFVSPAASNAALEAVWTPARGQPLAAFVNAYVEPGGVHTFYPSNPSQTYDVGAYLTNLVARFFQSNGTDIPYYTDPTGHQCLTDSSCAYIPRAP